MPAFRHEHLVRINDPANDLGAWLSRERLWAGLWQTLIAPQAFDATVDACRIDASDPTRIRRRLTRGDVEFHDTVEVSPGEAFRIVAEVAAGSRAVLTISIDEPAAGMLFVRFLYELESPAMAVLAPDEAMALRAAYEASDLDRVRQARIHAAHRPS